MAHLKRRWGPYWRVEMTMIGRRTALQALGLGVVAGALSVSTNQASAKEVDGSMLVPSDGHHLKELSEHLAKLPRRRDFKTVPMILTETDQWDAEALKSVIAYKSPYKQVWDNTEIGSPWLNLIVCRQHVNRR